MPTATIPAGQTYVDSPHGLGYTPDYENIVVNPLDDLGGRSWWKSDFGATTFRINIDSIDFADHLFSYTILVEPLPTPGGVSADEIRARFNLTATQISDVQTAKFRDEAAAWLSTQIGETLDPTSCTEAEGNAIKNLAALYCFCYVTGGSATGFTFNLGDIGVSEANQKQFDFYKEQVMLFVQKERDQEIPFVVGSDDSGLS